MCVFRDFQNPENAHNVRFSGSKNLIPKNAHLPPRLGKSRRTHIMCVFRDLEKSRKTHIDHPPSLRPYGGVVRIYDSDRFRSKSRSKFRSNFRSKFRNNFRCESRSKFRSKVRSKFRNKFRSKFRGKFRSKFLSKFRSKFQSKFRVVFN